MIRFFFPKIKEQLSTDVIHNRQVIAFYFQNNILLWMFWSLFFMVYANYQEVINLHNTEDIDICFANVFHYFFMIMTFLAIGVSQILFLSEEKASSICKALRGNLYKD